MIELGMGPCRLRARPRSCPAVAEKIIDIDKDLGLFTFAQAMNRGSLMAHFFLGEFYLDENM